LDIKAAERDGEVGLARRLIDGDTGAFDAFVAHFRTKVFQYTWLMCGHREDAEEVSQETLLKVFQNLNQLREPERVRPWVFRIARNECLMKRRKSVFAPAQELSLEELMPARNHEGNAVKLEIADWSKLPENEMLRKEMTNALTRAIAELPETYRSVILLRDMEELSTHDTAQILDINEDTVKTRLHRGRLALRKSLDSWLRGSNGQL